MHIPDGFLSARVAAGSGLVALLGLGIACARLNRTGDGSKSALLGVCAAFVFAAQLVNFPIAAGTSGHLLGGALCAVLVGLPAAVVIMSAVLIVQCLVFADGGLLALGANVTNMALVGPVVGACVYRLACGSGPSHTRRVASASFAGFCAVVASATGCAEQLALSGTARLGLILPAMVGLHALIGVVEAVITALIIASVLRARPALLEPSEPAAQTSFARTALESGLGLALVSALLLGPWASALPDGLSGVAARLGFHARAGSLFPAPFTHYRVPGLGDGALAIVLAGAFGTLVMFGLCWLLARALVPRQPRRGAARSAPGLESSG